MPSSCRSAASNELAALLGHPFQCNECGRTHQPNSRLINFCGRQFASKHVHPRTCYWYPATNVYWKRKAWREHNRQWTQQDDDLFTLLHQKLNGLGFHGDFEPATLTELTADNGIDLIKARHATWYAQCKDALARTKADAALVIAELDALLPPPYPVGTPVGILKPDGSSWMPAKKSQAEISRVVGLFEQKTRLSQEGNIITLRIPFPRIKQQRTSSGTAPLGGSPRTPAPAPSYYWTSSSRGLREILAETFSAPVPSRQDTHLIDGLGLDPTFWASLRIKKRTLILTTQPFSRMAMQFPEEQDGQFLLPLQ